MTQFAYPRPEVPRLTIAERDLRWGRLREAMRREGLDVLLAIHNSSAWDQGNANGRYISSIGGNCAWSSVVFPLDGEVTAITGPTPTADYWLQFQDWVTDVRTAFFHSRQMIVDRIKELKLEKGRVGIAGLQGVAREPDGLVSSGAMQGLREQLPGAEFVNATQIMYEVRSEKSVEEIEMFEQAMQVVDKTLDVFDQTARPGKTEAEVYGRVVSTLIGSGSEPNSLFLWTAGNPLPPMVATMPSQRRLGDNDVILIEIDAKVCGYLGHASVTKWLGPIDDEIEALASLQYEITQKCWEAMRPGRHLVDLVSICSRAVKGTGLECTPILHSRGLGFDAPVLVGNARDEWTRKWIIPANAVFVVKPMLATADGSLRMMWGDTVVVTENGARRLGKRPPPYVKL